MLTQANREFTAFVVLFAAIATFAVIPPARAQAPSAHAPPADAGPVSTRVELVADTLPKTTRAAVDLELETQLAAALAELDLVAATSESAELVLRVEVGQPNHKSPVYVVHSVALHEGQVLVRGDARTCLRCTPTELVSAGLAILPSAAAKARYARPASVEPPPLALTPQLADAGMQLGPRPTPPGPTAYVGIALGSLGLVGAITGGVLLNRDDVTRDGTEASLRVSDYGAPGIALLSAGLTSMVSGVALLVLDIWVLAPHRQAKHSRLAVSPAGLHF
ncbi:hypothetical protein DB30_03174 [Enhygromyxa salina]|uniref:Uncharacterized protein n=1 Tax=Enhygromyxa salina TaxID=215803 RepID=A0A0C2A240_9BACT|nr:hypothetical protein [Enhygromyxa salina]KIG17473.1 hypothetical protein DB30_03174 [Enhygromyxa salina]